MSTAEIATPMLSLEQKKRARNVGMSLIFLALVSAFFLSARPGDAGFKLVESFTLVLPAQPFAQALAVVLGALGAIQLYRGFGKWTNVVLAFATAMFVVGFLAWATSGGSFNLTGMLQDTVTRSVPITLGAIAGILCERSGIINIAIEGQLLGGAFAGAVLGSLYGPWVGLLGAMAMGVGLSALLAVFAIRFRVDQVIVGFAINFFSLGLTSFFVATCAHPLSRVQHRQTIYAVCNSVAQRYPSDWRGVVYTNVLCVLLVLCCSDHYVVHVSNTMGASYSCNRRVPAGCRHFGHRCAQAAISQCVAGRGNCRHRRCVVADWHSGAV